MYLKLRLKIILVSPFKGFDSGWPTRYIGLITELYKYHELHIYSPGDTSLLQALFPSASICNSNEYIVNPKRPNHATLIRDLVFTSKNDVCRKIGISHELYKLISNDKIRYDASIYFDRGAFICYGQKDRCSLILCDFCDSQNRHLDSVRKIFINKNRYLGWLYEYLFMIRIKRKFFPPYVHILAITENDAQHISAILPKNRVHTVPNGIYSLNIKCDNEFISNKYHSNVIVFVGSLDYEPNLLCIKYIIENLWPTISSTFQKTTFRVIGRSPTEWLKKLCENSNKVELIADVPDIYEYLKSAKLFLAPIFTGAGMKNKILESLNSGTPVVTTREGIIGLDLRSNVHGIVADSASGLVNGVQSILQADQNKYSEYVKACLLHAQKFSWDSVGTALNFTLQRLLKDQ